MKSTWLLSVIGVIALNVGVAAHAQSNNAATEKAVAGLENQWLESEKSNNADLAAPLFADSYMATGADGSISDKGQTLAEAKGRTFKSSVYEDLKVRAYGNTAIATGAWKGTGTESSGKAFSEYFRWTDTWIKMPDGKWQVVASHYSLIKPKT